MATTDPPVTVDIVDVWANAIRVPISDLRVGDRVFTPTGGTYALTRVKHYRHVVRFTREDDWTESMAYQEYDGTPATITIIREG